MSEKENEMEIAEKLVKEMGLIDELDAILAMYQFKSSRYVPGAGWWHIITRIGKAYADGELKLPGEVGRTEIDAASRITSGLLAFFQTWVREAITQKGAKILIALSPFPSLGIPVGRDPLGTGTGKEEAGEDKQNGCGSSGR